MAASPCQSCIPAGILAARKQSRAAAKVSLLRDRVSMDNAACSVVVQSLAVHFPVGMHTSATSQPGRAQLRALGS